MGAQGDGGRTKKREGKEKGKKEGFCTKKEMATHSSILAWKIPWTEEPGGLQSMGSQRVRHDLATKQEHIIAAAISLGLFVNSNVVHWYFQLPLL